MAAQHPLPPESELSENNPVKPETDGESQTYVDALEHLPHAGDSDHPENGAAKSKTKKVLMKRANYMLLWLLNITFLQPSHK